MRSGPIWYQLYVRPLSRWLTRTYSGSTEPTSWFGEGRKPMAMSSREMDNRRIWGEETSRSRPNIYQQRGDASIVLFVAKDVKDFLVAGTTSMMDEFIHALNSQFKPGNSRRESKYRFLVGIIWKDAVGNVTVSMNDYMDWMKNLCKPRMLKPTERATTCEAQASRSLAGTLPCLGQAVLLQASFIASKIQ